MKGSDLAMKGSDLARPSHRFALWAVRGGCTRGRKCACTRIRNLRGPFKKTLAEDARNHLFETIAVPNLHCKQKLIQIDLHM
jgi:hypothetical protein